MKILLVPFSFYPDAVTGADLRVEGIASRLLRRGVEVTVALEGKPAGVHFHDAIRVRRFLLAEKGFLAVKKAFGEVLDQERPDILHLHAFSGPLSLYLLQAAQQRGILTVFTYHVPRPGCLRGTLLRWGTQPCDGRLELSRCTRCMLQARGIPRLLTPWIERFSSERSRIGAHQTTFHLLMNAADHLVVNARWTQELLLRNGVDPKKITLSPNGFSQHRVPDSPGRRNGAALRIAFLGRLSPEKGLGLLLKALRRIQDPRVSLDLYCFDYKKREADRKRRHRRWLRRLKRLASADSRVRFREPVRPGAAAALLKGYDLLAVPSQWFEVSPMVVFEAFAAGIPVIGSNLGGIPELVRHEENGLLADPFSVRDWEKQLRRVVEDRALLAQLKEGVKPPRSMDEAAAEIERLYDRLLAKKVTEVLT